MKPADNDKHKHSPEGVEYWINMSSYRQILYHLVFRTKDSRKTIVPEHSRELYAYMMGFIKNKNCFLYQINGVENHIHILSDLHPTMALADFMRDIKTSSSIWLKQSGKFPEFEGWSDGYAALTYGWKDKEIIINYIKNQQQHHKIESFEVELKNYWKNTESLLMKSTFHNCLVQPLRGC